MTAFASLAGRRCLVVGGGGLIGTNLCRALMAEAAEVHGFGRSTLFPHALAGMRWTTGDLGDAAALARVVRGTDVVFHLAAGFVPNSSNLDPAGDVSASVLGSVELLEACRRAGVGRVVFVSSGGTVYGVTPSAPVVETAPTEPITAYGIGKLAIEKYLHLYLHLHGLDYVVLRVANGYGAFQTGRRSQGIVAALIRRVMAGRMAEVWGDGSVVRDFVHVDDIVAALIAATGYNGDLRVFNVGSGVGRSIEEVLTDLEAILQRGPIGRRYGRHRRADVPFNVLDCSRIRNEMNWSPRIDWQAGLRTTVEWHRAQPVEALRDVQAA